MSGGLGQSGPTWLDVTRLVSRAGRGVLTGIDRVELAYLDHLLEQGAADTRYLLRSTRGYLLLDRVGGAALARVLRGEAALPARGDLLSRALGKGSDPRHRVESLLRDAARDRCLRGGLARMIRRSGGGFVYLNTGHANLSEATLGAFGAAAGVRVAVLVHDLIPITHPDLVEHGMAGRFAGRIGRIARHADLVICNSSATEADLSAHWRGIAVPPPRIVAQLGLAPDARPVADVARRADQFVMLGTIEPRKNHALMLDVWELLAARLPPGRMPDLHIIGPVGWRVEGLMARLRAHPLLGRSIHLHGPLPEAEVRAHLARATALLFPSVAEGYGYPPLEALRAGALPICSDLPVFRETLGNSAVYLDATDTYCWLTTVEKHMSGIAELPRPVASGLPDWSVHFDRVGAALAR
ncbi:glycosyltransferase [Rhodobacterales bacterium HKCCSP123]|nr:glycosyltransferase [Rhodobacterales bacterium HKCCSP123]